MTVELNVNDTVNQYSKIGYLIEIKNSDEKDEIGEILINNKIDNKLILDNPTNKTYNTGTTVYLQTQIIKDYKITVEGFNEIGVFRKSSSYLTPGTPSNVYYTNNGTGTKEITFYIEYLY